MRGSAAKMSRRAVALVHVAVDHERPVGEPVAPQRGERDRDVVEQAVPAREVAPGVVRAAAEVHRHVVLERVAGGGDRAADRAAPALDQARATTGSPRPRSSRVVRQPSRMRESSPQSCTAASSAHSAASGLAHLVRRGQPVRDDPLGEQLVLRRSGTDAAAAAGSASGGGSRRSISAGTIDRHGPTSSYARQHRPGHRRLRRDRRRARARARPAQLQPRARRPPRRAAAASWPRSCG